MALYKLLVIIFIITLPSCAMMNVNYVDSSFNEKNLSAGNIIFGGLVSQKETWNEEAILKYSSIAVASLSHIRNDFIIKHYNDIIEQNKKQQLNEILEHIKNAILVDQAQLKGLINSSENFRYILFARLQSNNIRYSRSEQKDKNKDDIIIYKTMREVLIYVDVYDLDSSKVVWSGEIKKENANENKNPHDNSSNFLTDVISAMIEDAIYGTYPQAPSLEHLIKDAFEDVARSLPASDCGVIGLGECVKKAIMKSYEWLFGENSTITHPKVNLVLLQQKS